MTNLHLKRFTYLAGASLLFHSTTGFAQDDALSANEPCALELSVDNSVDWRGLYGRGYEVFEDGESFETVTISVRHRGAACCGSRQQRYRRYGC